MTETADHGDRWPAEQLYADPSPVHAGSVGPCYELKAAQSVCLSSVGHFSISTQQFYPDEISVKVIGD